jgi:hypothetical protein
MAKAAASPKKASATVPRRAKAGDANPYGPGAFIYVSARGRMRLAARLRPITSFPRPQLQDKVRSPVKVFKGRRRSGGF